MKDVSLGCSDRERSSQISAYFVKSGKKSIFVLATKDDVYINCIMFPVDSCNCSKFNLLWKAFAALDILEVTVHGLATWYIRCSSALLYRLKRQGLTTRHDLTRSLKHLYHSRLITLDSSLAKIYLFLLQERENVPTPSFDSTIVPPSDKSDLYIVHSLLPETFETAGVSTLLHVFRSHISLPLTLHASFLGS